MAVNADLASAKNAKKDEFYTQYSDIEAEMNAYITYNPDVFRDKTILLPCDDPEWSNFTRYFASNFVRFGLKKLISTSYAFSSGNANMTRLEANSPLYDAAKHETCGKLFILEADTDGNGSVDEDDMVFARYLEGDGDFRSEEVTKLRDEADIIITNPPFSLFREFVSWIMEAKKQFIIIGNVNAITYKEFFPYLKENLVWLGYSIHSGDRAFYVPDDYPLNASGCGVDEQGRRFIRVKGVRWFTNIDHCGRHEVLPLDTKAHNVKYNKKLRKKLEFACSSDYVSYDNYDAIEVPFTECIPSDYDGFMGVPITFLDKYCPEQFDIVGLLQSSTDEQAGIPNLRYYNDFKEMRQDMSFTGSSGGKANGNPVVKGKSQKGNFLFNPVTGEYVHSVYARILIRHKKGVNT